MLNSKQSAPSSGDKEIMLKSFKLQPNGYNTVKITEPVDVLLFFIFSLLQGERGEAGPKGDQVLILKKIIIFLHLNDK